MMHFSNDSASPSNAYFSEEDEYDTNPTHLLSLAIKKRRTLLDARDSNMRVELQLTGMIKSLCKFLGEDRAKRRHRHRRCRSRSRSHSKKRRWDSLEPVSRKNRAEISNPSSNDIENIEKSISNVQVVPHYQEQNIQSPINVCESENLRSKCSNNDFMPLVKQAKFEILNGNSMLHFKEDLNKDDPLGLDELFSCFNGSKNTATGN